MITQKVCRIEWEEDCSTSKKKIGEKVVYEDFPSLGIAGGPGKAYQECEMVTKEFCKDVPRNEDVMGDVETCVNTPKEVCEDGKQRAQKQICERVKPAAAKTKM